MSGGGATEVACERCGRIPAEQRFELDGAVVHACNACVDELTEYGWLRSWLTVQVRRRDEAPGRDPA